MFSLTEFVLQSLYEIEHHERKIPWMMPRVIVECDSEYFFLSRNEYFIFREHLEYEPRVDLTIYKDFLTEGALTNDSMIALINQLQKNKRQLKQIFGENAEDIQYMDTISTYEDLLPINANFILTLFNVLYTSGEEHEYGALAIQYMSSWFSAAHIFRVYDIDGLITEMTMPFTLYFPTYKIFASVDKYTIVDIYAQEKDAIIPEFKDKSSFLYKMIIVDEKRNILWENLRYHPKYRNRKTRGKKILVY